MSNKASYEVTQTNAFAALVNDGTYSEKFDHAPHAQEFFHREMTRVLAMLRESKVDGVRVLDCGCGNGAWLDFMAGMVKTVNLESIYGFDLTQEMVDIARNRLSGTAISTHLQTGNILEPDAYKFPDSDGKYDLVFTYDVVQQLPRKLQFRACEVIIDQLADGGIAVIFDNDSNSKFGKRMAWRKFLTRYFGLRLVPRYFCNAHYPPLEKFATRLAATRGLDVSIDVSSGGVKRALIVHKVGV